MNGRKNTSNENTLQPERNAARMPPTQMFLWVPVGLGIGIALYFSAHEEPEIWAGGAAVILFGTLSGFLRYRPSTKTTAAFPFLISVLVIAIGFSLATLHTNITGTTLLPATERFMLVKGTVEKIERRPSRTRLTLEVVDLEPAPAGDLPERVRVSIPKNQEPSIGDLVDIKAVITGPGPPAVPGGFDFRRWSWFHKLGGSGFAVGPVTVISKQETSTLQSALNRLRDMISRRITEAYPNQAGAIAAAVIVGDRSGLNEETLEAMRASGLAHLLAISGLHLGLLAGTVFFSLRLILAGSEITALGLSIKKIAACFALVASFLYVILAGAPIPTIRAFVMTGLVLLAVLTDRSAISMRLVAWAAIVILALQPESMMGPSFQMSFAAVVALVAFYESTITKWRSIRSEAGWPKMALLYFFGIMVTTIIAGSATAPFAWHHFGQVGGFGAIANLAAIPIMAFLVMPFALLGLLFMPFGLEGIVLWPAITGLQIILAIAETIAGIDGAIFKLPFLPTPGLIAFVAGGLWLCLWRAKHRHLGWLLVCVGIAIGTTSIRPDVLIAGNSKVMAVNSKNADNTLLLDEVGKERFLTEKWQQAYGVHTVHGMNDMALGTGVLCDSFGCVLTRKGKVVALIRDPRALMEDCQHSTVVVAPIPVHPAACKGPDILIDYFSLRRHGTHALYISEDGIAIETAGTEGNRLWQRGGGAGRSNTDASGRRADPER